jgi:hypothetical protein
METPSGGAIPRRRIFDMSREDRRRRELARQERRRLEKLREKEELERAQIAIAAAAAAAARKANRKKVVNDTLADAGFALAAAIIVTLLLGSLAAAGVITMPLALMLLGATWLAGVGTTFILPHPPTQRNKIIFAAIFAVLLSLVGWYEATNYDKPITLKEMSDLLLRPHHVAFSDTQRIVALPPELGGNEVLHLDNIATLRLFAPYSLSSVTLLLDATPIKFPDREKNGWKFQGGQIFPSDPEKLYFDNENNKRKEISAGGRTFIVTLQETEKLNIPGVENPIQWTFGISEK